MAHSPGHGPVDRGDILDLVHAAGVGITTAEVAAKTGLRLSTVRSHLDGLVEAGLLVKARASSGLPYRPAWRYRPFEPDTPTTYRLLLAALLEHLVATDEDSRPAAVRVGQRWGRSLGGATGADRGTKDTLLAVLEALGFSPQEPAGGGFAEVHLRTCPYLDLVRGHPDAMCGLHAGIIQGVLEQADAAGRVVLEPFAAPGACVVRLVSGSPS
jgi:predicted ArsR family transcriptional regulator